MPGIRHLCKYGKVKHASGDSSEGQKSETALEAPGAHRFHEDDGPICSDNASKVERYAQKVIIYFQQCVLFFELYIQSAIFSSTDDKMKNLQGGKKQDVRSQQSDMGMFCALLS